MRLTPLMTLLVLGSCSDAVPCSMCPEIDGIYAVSWGDAGVANLDDGGACPVSGPRVPEWTLVQRNSQVTSTIAGVNLGGTLYDSYDLALSGAEGTLSYRLRALTIPEGTGADAGIRLQGSFTTRNLPPSGEPCEVSEPFTAQRTGR